MKTPERDYSSKKRGFTGTFNERRKTSRISSRASSGELHVHTLDHGLRYLNQPPQLDKPDNDLLTYQSQGQRFVLNRKGLLSVIPSQTQTSREATPEQKEVFRNAVLGSGDEEAIQFFQTYFKE